MFSGGTVLAVLETALKLSNIFLKRVDFILRTHGALIACPLYKSGKRKISGTNYVGQLFFHEESIGQKKIYVCFRFPDPT